MTAISVAPDKSYFITEEHLRFPVAADVPPGLVPFVIYTDLKAAIEVFEKHRGWTVLDRVPSRKQFPLNKPCCPEIATRKSGERLEFKFVPSNFQGDIDDAMNFDELSDRNKRLLVENTIDWEVIMHFWTPAIFVNNDAENEYRNALGLKEGFAPVELVPQAAVSPKMKRRFGNKK